LILSTTLLAQNGISADTALAAGYFTAAGKLYSEGQYDSCITVYQLASDMYLRYKLWENYLNCRNRIGRCYDLSGQYDTALTILSQALETGKKYLGEKNRAVATSYNNIGIVYNSKGEFDKALEYYSKALKLREELFGEKDPDVAQSYNNVGVAFVSKCEYDKALKFYHNGLIANIKDFADENMYSNPLISNFIGVEVLLNCLQGKGEAFLLKSLKSDSAEADIVKDLNASYSNLILCDRLIQQMRKSYLRESEKLTWNENIKSVYNCAIEVCV